MQIRTLKQLQAAEAQRIADTEKLIASLTPVPSRIDADVTPKQQTRALPGAIVVPPSSPPPQYTATSSSGTDDSHTKTETSKTDSSQRPTLSSEIVKSPFPTPTREGLPLSPSEATIHPPPSPEEISAQLSAIVEEQDKRDREFDAADLRALMKAALAMSSDAEMLRVLQIKREDMPEALKTLQRALERERAREAEEAEKQALGISGEEGNEDDDEDGTEVGTAPRSRGGYPGALRLTGLKRRLTMDSVVTRASRRSKTSKKGGSRRSNQTQPQTERDTLDREFIETGIDALRRLSKSQDLNLPNWTITK